MKEYKVTTAYMDNYGIAKYENGELIGDVIVPYYKLDGYIDCLEGDGYTRMLDDDLEMNYAEFISFCKDEKIKCSDQTMGLLRVFGEEVYSEYFDLIQNQILEPEGYELLIRKKNTHG